MSKLKAFNVLAIMAFILAACAAPVTPTAAPAALAPAATQAPTAQAPAATQTPAATQAPIVTQSGLANVPRNRTLILAGADVNPIGLTNPWAVPGYTHQFGNAWLWDVLAYYSIMSAAGFTYIADSLWADGKGNTVNATINGFEGIHSDLAPVLAEMLKTGGFDANVNLGDSNRFSRYKDPEYDALLATMAPLSADDPKFQDAAAKALGIYWRDTIDIPIIQWLHRIPYNQTYWTNWPLANNLADGENGAFRYFTGMIVVTNLKPVQ